MDEEESMTTLTTSTTKQDNSSVRLSLVINKDSSFPVTFLAHKDTAKTSWEQTACLFSWSWIPAKVRVLDETVKDIEDIETFDFIKASRKCKDKFIILKEIQNIEMIDANTVKLTLECGVEEEASLICRIEQPFFIFCAGWASLVPFMTKDKYGISCKILSEGDIIIGARTKLN